MSKRVLLYSLGIFATALLITYLVDYVVLQYRIRTGKVPFDQVMVTTYYAIHQKSGKTDYSMQDPQPDGCVDSLLPHLSMPPCWYLRRHPEKRIDI